MSSFNTFLQPYNFRVYMKAFLLAAKALQKMFLHSAFHSTTSAFFSSDTLAFVNALWGVKRFFCFTTSKQAKAFSRQNSFWGLKSWCYLRAISLELLFYEEWDQQKNENTSKQLSFSKSASEHVFWALIYQIVNSKKFLPKQPPSCDW